MNKREFLDVLRQFLNGEVKKDVIELNIRYYDQYISAQSPEEEAKVIEMLGDPRLIARTIIEKEKAVNQKTGHYRDNNNRYSSSQGEDDEEGYNQKHSNKGRNIFKINLNWKQKAILFLILIVVIFLIIVIGKIIIGFLFTFGVPILLLLLLYNLFKKRN